ncbi:MAG: PD-(D/E)XK nuclease domain-containing protein, partial [Myxococcota bacterium]
HGTLRADLAEAWGVSAEVVVSAGGGDNMMGAIGTGNVRVTWCLGHLVELEEPGAYNPDWKAWRLESLPMLPDAFALKPRRSSVDQWKVVKALLRQRGAADRFDVVRTWYDGYRFGRETTIYNPWSVINYLANPNDAAQPYWVNTSSNHLVHYLLTRADAGVKRGLRQLLDEENPVTIQRVQQNIPLQELEADPENLWGLLLASGYLTLHPRLEEGKENTARESALRIPNKEVWEVYDALVRRWLRGGQKGSGSGTELLDALVAGETDLFAEGFPQLVQESVSYFDTAGDKPERFYHGFVLGMLQVLRDRYHIRSERESGGGRYDLGLEPKDKSKLGFVLEFKKAPLADGTLEQAADKALHQIKEMEYHADLLARGVEEVIALGLAFRGKEVAVKHEALTAGQDRLNRFYPGIDKRSEK